LPLGLCPWHEEGELAAWPSNGLVRNEAFAVLLHLLSDAVSFVLEDPFELARSVEVGLSLPGVLLVQVVLHAACDDPHVLIDFIEAVIRDADLVEVLGDLIGGLLVEHLLVLVSEVDPRVKELGKLFFNLRKEVFSP